MEYKIKDLAVQLNKMVLMGDCTHNENKCWKTDYYVIHITDNFLVSVTKRVDTVNRISWSLNIGVTNCFDTYTLSNGADVLDIVWELTDMCNIYGKWWESDGVRYNCGSLWTFNPDEE